MADRSTQSVVVDATPEQILAVIADFPQYPQWVSAVKECEVLDRYPDGAAKQVSFVLDAGVVKDTYTLQYHWHGGDGVSWTLVKGQMQRSQEGEYRLRPVGTGTEVTYSLAVELSIPMLGMLKRKAEKVIMDTALKELKRRVEG